MPRIELTPTENEYLKEFLDFNIKKLEFSDREILKYHVLRIIFKKLYGTREIQKQDF